MRQVLIIVNAEVKANGTLGLASPVTSRMVTALESALAQETLETKVNVVSASELWSNSFKQLLKEPNLVFCPLTIQLPHWLDFPGYKIYHDCRDMMAQRQWVEENLGYPTCQGESGLGDRWLPIIHTAQATLYGDIIGEGAIPNSYEQPIHLPSKVVQNLYSLSKSLLDHLNAPPSVYLLQFRRSDQGVLFDRLWPFPAAPAIASLSNSESNLYADYWRCITQKTIKRARKTSDRQKVRPF